jgi:hypothetical protein
MSLRSIGKPSRMSTTLARRLGDGIVKRASRMWWAYVESSPPMRRRLGEDSFGDQFVRDLGVAVLEVLPAQVLLVRAEERVRVGLSDAVRLTVLDGLEFVEARS